MQKYTLKIIKLATFMALSFGIALAANAKSSNADSPLNTAKKNYLMGVFPYLAPRELEKMYAPIAADLSRHVFKNRSPQCDWWG